MAQPALAVALGDPAGIGPEITGAAWEQRASADVPTFFAVGDSRALAGVWNGPLVRIFDPKDANTVFPHALPVMHIVDAGPTEPGEPTFEGAQAALTALETAVGLTRSGAAGGLVTGPVCKAQLYSVGFTHAGQTEFVAERCGVAPSNAVMMLAGPSLRVVPVTTHVPLRDVPDLLSVDLLVAKGRATARGLQRLFGIASPRLAFAALNPHSGEDGAIGREEIEIIAPAVAALRALGIDAVGPIPGDTLFAPRMRESYDAAMCMYHDQALIPLKALHFDEGVNMTLGLPIVRASPDHGTAFDIAGKRVAHPGAMIAAIRMAAEASEARAKAA